MRSQRPGLHAVAILSLIVACAALSKKKSSLSKRISTRFSAGSPSGISRPISRCGKSCRFRFCDDSNELLLLASQDIAYEPSICLGKDKLVSVGKTGEGLVAENGSRTAISKLKRRAPKQAFSPSFFKILQLADSGTEGVGVAHETAQEDQAVAIAGRCVLLPIKRYQIQEDLHVKNGVGGGRRDCVGLHTFLPSVVVELTWSSGDDLDLIVIDPSGEELSVYNSVVTGTGELLFDDNISVCGELSRGREVSVFGRVGKARKGKYEVFIKHWENCDGKATKFRIRVFIEGVLKITKDGTSRLGREAVVESSRTLFRFG